MKAYSASIAVAITLSSYCRASPIAGRDNGTMISSFEELIPSPKLQWTPCFENFTCALLQVPLDYSDLSAGTTNLGIIKSPADTEDAQEVLINPGGPGGSSVAQVQFGYADIQEKIGTQFSIVGIDPRGVANSGPSSDCFPGFSHIARNSYVADVNSIPDTTSDYALRQNHEYMKGYGRWCSSVYAVNQTAKYAGTVATAQDMLHYIELDAEQKGNDPKEAKLFFYGISYGTALGSTFASLYPDRIGRMIIDGVVDTEDHFNGGWETSIVDNDKVVQQFFKKCFEAGPELCHFHRNASSWTELEERFQALFEHLKQHPIAVGSLAETQALLPQNLTLTPALFTWKDLTDIMFGTLYILTPTAYAELDAILTGLLLEIHTGAAALPPKAQISSMSPSRHDERTARFLINCLYANARFNTSDFAAYKSFVGGMHNSSRYAGLKAATYSGPICSHLDVRPPESQVFDGVPRMSSTSAPILLVSTLLDPITPLPSARKMHALFPGSGLLIANTSGHCAHFQKSACVAGWEKKYMRDGTLPPEGTVCEVDYPDLFLAAAELAGDAAEGLSGAL